MPHRDAVPACCFQGHGVSCQASLKAAHVCLINRRMHQTLAHAGAREKTDRAVEIKQTR